jgi:hypothetical protein
MDAVTRKERTPWLIRLLMGRPAWREVTETNYAGVGGYFTERSVRYLG